MAKVIVTAHACTFEQRPIGRSMSYMPFDPAISRTEIDAAAIRDVEEALNALGARIAVSHPTSFFVIAAMGRGEHALRGFNRRKWMLEFDRCTSASAPTSD